jgi:hypothetical protein
VRAGCFPSLAIDTAGSRRHATLQPDSDLREQLNYNQGGRTMWEETPMLEIAPALEHAIKQRAAATSMTPDQYLTRLIAADPTPAAQPEPDRKALELIMSIQRWQAIVF